MLLFRGYGPVWLGRAGSAGSTPPTIDRSGITRLWLIDYYTRAFAKPLEKVTPVVQTPKDEKLSLEVAERVEARSRAREKAVRERTERNEAIPRVRELIARAEVALRDKSEADVAKLVRAALEYKPLVIDFAVFEAELAAKREAEDADELMLFAMVL